MSTETITHVDPVVQAVDKPDDLRHAACPECWHDRTTGELAYPALALCGAPLGTPQTLGKPKHPECFHCQECQNCGAWVCFCHGKLTTWVRHG